ncbi:MAG TPA: tetratricopeptide repeat protein [Tepidisphaeraceae bacterium]|nr:tetratricopeptide repeat protein [Tepidisphaeraceae bacterium]
MPEMTLQQGYQLAAEQHRAGRVREAEAFCRQILQQQPAHVETLLLLARIAHEGGQAPEATELLRKVVALRPNIPEAHSNLGTLLAMAGKFDEAIPEFHAALALRPDDPAFHNNLGNAFRGKQDNASALEHYRQAIRLRPDYADAHNNLAGLLHSAGQKEQAVEAFRALARLRPADADAAYNFAKSLSATGAIDQAIAAYRRAIELRPDFLDAISELLIALGNQGAVDQAIVLARRAVALRPDLPQTHNNLGWVLQKKEAFDEATAEYQRAIELRPQYAEAYNNLGSVLFEAGRFHEAIETLQKALSFQPDHAAIAANIGIMMLTVGDFERGWPVYEARRRVIPVSLDSDTTRPRWDGSDLSGKTIVIQSEQGYGDSIQFARYMPLVRAHGGRVVLQCPPGLKKIFSTVAGADQVLADNEPLPPFDVHTRLLSLPGIFHTNLESISANVPYLHAEAELVERWRRRILAEPPGLKVGLSWAGNPTHPQDRHRSIPLSALAPLPQAPGVRFYSVQKGDAARQALSPPPGMSLTDWTADLHDFADTAALVQNLDLVITVDSAVAHLVGAMGLWVWVLVQHIPDWRWLLARSDSPWYPTMRLFRQPQRCDWTTPIAQVAGELRGFRPA